VNRNLASRIAVAVVFIPLILWICYRGEWWLFGMVLLLALAGLAEFLIREGHRPVHPTFWLSLVTAAVLVSWPKLSDFSLPMAVSSGPLIPLGSGLPGLLLAAFFAVGAMLFAIGKRPPGELFVTHARLMWGILYIGLLYPFVYLLGHMLDHQSALPVSGGDGLLFLFGLLWLGDTAAMAIGKAVGKRQLAPTVSPNKTVAGFIGGLLGAATVGVVMALWKFESVPFYHVMIIALGCSVFGQMGDLVESMWKRSLQIKDSSAVIPGHGGVLDRFDSLLFAAPFMAVYIAAVLL
jgi:phosphatidate cytidylyltransferase